MVPLAFFEIDEIAGKDSSIGKMPRGCERKGKYIYF
jgi:hypothetical protein